MPKPILIKLHDGRAALLIRRDSREEKPYVVQPKGTDAFEYHESYKCQLTEKEYAEIENKPAKQPAKRASKKNV